jgi:hypothetical protein
MTMKTSPLSVRWSWLAVPTAALFLIDTLRAANSPIPFSEIGAKVTADYQGDALAIVATPDGARLRCGFQKLEGRATTQGLWLESTVPGGGRFRLTADALGRESSGSGEYRMPRPVPPKPSAPTDFEGYEVLQATGKVDIADKLVRFTRPMVTEEYSVSVDGVRQDFIIPERPAGAGDLRVELALTGARAEAAAYGAKLVMEGSERALAYSRLRATDATGKQLKARLEVLWANRLALRVEDADATYPVGIDPTFSDANWISVNWGMPGANGAVAAITVDGSGNVYVGGSFTFIGTVLANYVAKWDGSAWSALGSGIGGAGDGYGPSVSCLACDSSGNVYAGGDFSTAGGVAANYVAKWNGSVWSSLGSVTDGIEGQVYALAVSGTNLYVGGIFALVGGWTANYIAVWNGRAWSSLGSGSLAGVSGPVYALAVSGTNLYVGGAFSTAGGVSANDISVWNGRTWSALGQGFNNTVAALVASGTNLYAGGYFLKTGEATANYVAAWNGSVWSPLGSGLNSPVYVLAVDGTNLYAGGTFTTAGGVAANHLAAWNGSTWSALGSGMNSFVHSLAVSGSNLYAGGNFTMAGGVSANYISAWNGGNWSALGSGMNGSVHALTVSGTNLYAGGAFITAVGLTANYIAAWNGSVWSALGSGMNGGVGALAVSGTNLYAGGDFTTAGGVAANYVAAWDGSAWSPLGSGMNGPVYALAVSGTNLYAGGAFTTAGGMAANYVAGWDGNAWSSLGAGVADGVEFTSVSALLMSGSNLYAGGNFTTAGGMSANSIAAWNGSAWSALGSGMSSYAYGNVTALATSGSTLYAGGYFTTAGGVSANYISAWDGSTWSALGEGFNNAVAALVVSGTNLYAGGGFTTAGGNPANYIAQWDGSSWSALGSGMNNSVQALAVSGNNLYVGGYFTAAGGKASAYAAEAVLAWPEILTGPVPNADGSLTLSLSTGTNSSSRLYAATNLTPPVAWQPLYTNLTGGLWQFVDTNTALFKTKFYRLATP